MSYILVSNLTFQYIQSLIARSGFTDVTAQYPDWGNYSIQDLDGNINSFMDLDGMRRWLIAQIQLQNPYACTISAPTDQNYPDGTVVCPNLTNQMVKCTHDNCPFAGVYSEGSVISAGQVTVKTAATISPRTHVVSDGQGGVRAAATGEAAHVIGFAVSTTQSAQVAIVLKSYFGVVA